MSLLPQLRSILNSPFMTTTPVKSVTLPLLVTPAVGTQQMAILLCLIPCLTRAELVKTTLLGIIVPLHPLNEGRPTVTRTLGPAMTGEFIGLLSTTIL